MWQGLIIFGAAFVAGMVNSVAGGGTLISFPVLIWLGLDPKIANVTNTVALWPGSLGAWIGFRREIAGSGRWMAALAGPSIIGGLAGAALLLATSSRTFSVLVPYLILFATILFAVGDRITRRVRPAGKEISSEQAVSEPGRVWWIGAAVFQFFVAVYGGYFGAGIGILMLAALGLLGLTDIHQMNGLKNFFAMCINLVSAFYFMLEGPVEWAEAIVMAVGAVAGGFGGAGLARRLGRNFVRRAVIFIGLAMALSLMARR
ncbi:MAG TPA: sulfite exporter TauE/SafE family protein [Blastocatellia bacterium]|nr:sulfite exporter TauE/SafE family protein [Blastocatellia bacterium]